MKEPKIYYATPITGTWGDDASLAYIRQNCDFARTNVSWLRKSFPQVQWYCPAEHDDLIQVLFLGGRLKKEDIMWGCKELLQRYDGIFAHLWESSKGVQAELDFCNKLGKKAFVWSGDVVLGEDSRARESLVRTIDIFVKEVTNI